MLEPSCEKDGASGYRKPASPKPHPGHTVYPYLLRGLDVRANHVWCADITYIPAGTRVLLPCRRHGLGKQEGIVLGDYRTPWMPRSPWRPLKKRACNTECLVYSTPTRKSVYIGQFHCGTQSPWNKNQHGRTGTVEG